MDRIIEIKVNGNYLTKDNKNAGVRGEGNVTNLRITFDEGWDGYAKKVTFWDARGTNPVERTLTTDCIEDIVKNERVYIIPIPSEPMAEAGELTFVIDGYNDGKRQRSVSDKLEVKDAPIADNAGEPADPTPTQAEQLQEQYESILYAVQRANESTNSILNMGVSAETIAPGEQAYANSKTDIADNGHIISANLTFGIPAGEKGEKGDPGNDGTSVTISSIEESSAPGASSFVTFSDGKVLAIRNGTPGQDGISCRHWWDGTTLIISSENGTSYADLKGDDGYTPKKGVDYFTPADIESLGIDDKADKSEVVALSSNLQQIGDVTSFLFSSAERKSYKVNDLNTGNISEEYYPSTIAVKSYIDGITGDIETALDNIIAMQTNLIGGDSE